MRDGCHPNDVFKLKVAQKIANTIKLMFPINGNVEADHMDQEDDDDDDFVVDDVTEHIRQICLSQ